MYLFGGRDSRHSAIRKERKNLKYILILEDDADLAAGMEMALMSDDFSFTICSTIKEAEEKFRQQTFDLLILDVNLPDDKEEQQGIHYPPHCQGYGAGYCAGAGMRRG